MVEDMGDLEQNVKDPDDPASGHDEDSINQSVFDNLVNERNYGHMLSISQIKYINILKAVVHQVS